jgi:hypothetical protein
MPTAKSKLGSQKVGFEVQSDKRVKVWPGNQPLHHEFISQADFDARFETVPETETIKPKV